MAKLNEGVELVRGVKCIKCAISLQPKDFNTPDHLREFMMFGLCEPCQKKNEPIQDNKTQK